MSTNRKIEDYPLVTVITVTYNSSAYVRDAIESILSSSYENFELIIGDDSSPDDTWAIIQEYTDRRIVSYRNESNLGEYPNRNKAINLATGKYLIFIDGDDMIYPHGLEFMVRFLEAFPDCGMALMYPYLNWMYYPAIVTSRDFYVSNFFSKGFNDLAFANTLFNTRILKEASMLPLTYKAGDTYVRLKIASKYPTLLVQDQLTWWRETPGQASESVRNTPSAIVENYLLHAEIILDSTNPLSEDERIKAMQNEMYKMRMILFSFLKRLKLKSFVLLLSAIFRQGFIFKLLSVGRTYSNPFAQYSPGQPFRLSNSEPVKV